MRCDFYIRKARTSKEKEKKNLKRRVWKKKVQKSHLLGSRKSKTRKGGPLLGTKGGTALPRRFGRR